LIHLDTSFLVDVLRETRRREHGRATELLNQLVHEDLRVSVHVLCELFAGAALTEESSDERPRVQDLVARLRTVYPDERFVPAYAALVAGQRRAGRLVATMDLLIATGALVEGAPLVTRDVRDFSRIAGLVIRTY
jgi:tRNA(fMet)-specific endonuclease VapC